MDSPVKRTIYDWTLEISSISCLVCVFIPLFFYESLDHEALIPVHYNASGQIDRWGDCTHFWDLPLVASAFYIGLSILERFYSRFNYPVKITKENAQTIYRLGVALIRHMKLAMILIFAYLNNSSFFTVMGKREHFNRWIVYMLLFALIFILLTYCIKMIRIRKKDSN